MATDHLKHGWSESRCAGSKAHAKFNDLNEVERWWLAPVILTTQETDQEDCAWKLAKANSS
jgi:hypothetical protein